MLKYIIVLPGLLRCYRRAARTAGVYDCTARVPGAALGRMPFYAGVYNITAGGAALL